MSLFKTYSHYTLPMGNNGEENFKHYCSTKNIKCDETTHNENLKHKDFYIFVGNKKMSVDVKAMKRIRRSDNNPQDKYIWIELQNDYSHKGWIWGKQNLIAFQTQSDYIICYTDKLREYVYKNLINEFCNKATVGKIYVRKNHIGEAHLTIIEKDKIPKECIFNL